jgi:hypothetical protein
MGLTVPLREIGCQRLRLDVAGHAISIAGHDRPAVCLDFGCSIQCACIRDLSSG